MPSEWQSPRELPDLRRVGIIALDCETKDKGLHAKCGPGWPWRGGYITGISVAWRADGVIRAIYIPLRHPDSQNFEREQVIRWLKDLIASGVKIITKNGLYDWGWLWADLDIEMPPAEQLEEIDALATMVDENRLRYSLDALCTWRGFPGKDETLLLEGCAALGLIPARKRKTFKPQSVLWQLPAHLVGPYAETDAIRTLELFESLNPVLDREGTRDAYRLEIDLLPMVHRMRRRGIRIDISAAEQTREALLHKRDTVLAQISEKLEASTGMDEINGRKWLISTFDRLGIKYPLTEKGNPSFKRGKRGWMQHSEHWLPPLLAAADQLDQYGNNFIQQQILNHVENGRVYGEVHPHRNDYGGTRSLRFSYSHPPLQQMPKHDEELAPLIRSVFLPEEDEVWASCDYSQQEFRLVVHFAARKNLRGALAARDRYISDPDTDIHAYTSELTGGVISRQDGKTTNFMMIYGAGPETIALQIKKSLNETKTLLALYNEKMPFISQLANACKNVAHRDGAFTLFNRARRHFNLWFPGGHWEEGAGPCERKEAERRVHDPGHPWYGRQLWRAETFKALNMLIQSSAAIQTKEWMRACYREGIVPLLQMHDSLDLSVVSPDVAEMVARLGEDVIKLEVPMKVDVKYGRTWGDAKHTWAELHADAEQPTPITVELDWSAALERDFPRTKTNGGFETLIVSDEPPPPPPPQNDEAYIRMRMAEEGITWQSASFAQAIPPTSPSEPPPTSPPPPPTSPPIPPPKSPGSSGNGRDNYPHGERTIGHKVTEFFYRDLKGALYLRVDKYVTAQGEKSFPQYRFDGGRWLKRGENWPSIPYRLPELLAAPRGSTVDIGEGEKDADNLAKLGLIATTNPGGAGKWTPELNKWFTGFARANIYEDNDKPGHKHAAEVATALCVIIPDVRIVKFRELPEKGDVSDWLKNHTLAELRARADASPQFAALESINAADVEIEDYDWVWPARFALKKIGLVVGLPDEGKGLAISDVVARITRAGLWPCGEGQAPLGNVIILSAEDDIADTIVPRLMAADADLARVTIVKMMRDTESERMFSLVTDLPALRQKILEIGEVKMVIIDPVTAYLGVGKIDSFRATDVRAVLSPLKDLAEQLRVSIIGIMHFNKKIDITNILLRISDSLAYSAASRHVYGVINDPDNRRRLFVKGKGNLIKYEQPTLAFSIEEREVGTDKRTGLPIRRPYIVWHDEPVDITAVEAMQAATENKSPSARDNAKRFIETLLSNGPIGSKDVQEAARENGISKKTLERAREALGDRVAVKKDGPLNEKGETTWRWHWMLKQENEDGEPHA